VHEDLLDACLLRRVRKRNEMLVVTVHPAIGNQPDKVEPCRSSICERFLQNVVSLQLALGDRFVDPGQILINDAPSAEVKMPDLGVTHLAGRQTDIFATRA